VNEVGATLADILRICIPAGIEPCIIGGLVIEGEGSATEAGLERKAGLGNGRLLGSDGGITEP